MKHNIFFGAGKIGKRELEYWQKRGASPDYFVDNDESKWGSTYLGIPVISLEQAVRVDNTWFWITCADRQRITEQLISTGVDRADIKNKSDVSDLFYAYCQSEGFLRTFEVALDGLSRAPDKVIFELEHGLTLGGVETWTVEMMGRLVKKGYDVKCLTNNNSRHLIRAGDIEFMELDYRNIDSVEDRVIRGVNEILRALPCNMICSFPETDFIAGCIVKKLYPERINIIAVVHNDEPIYYDRYGLWQEYIDHLLVISDKMRKTVEKILQEPGKTHYLGWHIPCEAESSRDYSRESEPLKLGYAGRLAIMQKRSDLLIEIAARLKEQQIDYVLEIAGTGEYEQEMRKAVQTHGLEDSVKFLGLIDRAEIPEFWRRQDIAIGCSDFEGRSITKAEAMASGAVPVVSDTSGARDDIIDGWNGYVLECGRWEPFVETIGALAKDRKKIETMGRNAHQTILENNERNAKSNLWERILK